MLPDLILFSPKEEDNQHSAHNDPAQPTFQAQCQTSSPTAFPLIFTTALQTGFVLGNTKGKLREMIWVPGIRQLTWWIREIS